MKKLVLVLAVVLAAVLILPVGANAGTVSVTVKAVADNGGSFIKTFTGETVAAEGGGFECVLVAKVDEQVDPDGGYATFDGGAITCLKLTMDSDPEVGIEFGVRAGSTLTTFDILSDIVLFDALVNPQAYASAGVTLTDRPTVSGAAITGLFDQGKTHQARYNSSSVFANLVSGFGIPSGTLTASEEKGNEFSMITIGDTLTSIESEFHFTLSARDSASGTSNFVVIPEPTTIALLGLGVLGFLRRK